MSIYTEHRDGTMLTKNYNSVKSPFSALATRYQVFAFSPRAGRQARAGPEGVPALLHQAHRKLIRRVSSGAGETVWRHGN